MLLEFDLVCFDREVTDELLKKICVKLILSHVHREWCDFIEWNAFLI